MYREIVFNLILLSSISAFPECAEFHFPNSTDDNSLNADEKEFKQRTIPKLFDSFDGANLTDYERTLNTLKPFPETSQRQESLISKTIKQIDSDGYPSSVHQVITKDGYILEMHRLFNETLNETRPAVLVMHGLLESSHGWIALGPENSLAYILYDNGYDVWLGNVRGTKASKKHIRFTSNGAERKKFWSFSLHEIGVYDLPRCIDYILEKTNQSQLHYIGYSQGTTVFFIMASQLPEYNAKIKQMFALAPVAFLRHSNNYLLSVLDSNYKLISSALNYFGVYSVDPGNSALNWITEYACKKIDDKSPVSCQFILWFFDSNQINCTSLPRIVQNTPNTASLMQLYHFAQLKRSGEFRTFQKTIDVSKTSAYNLTHVTAPITILYSMNDETANYTDVELLATKLPNVREMYQIPNDDFKHIDFIYSRYVRKLVNEKIINVLNAKESNCSKSIKMNDTRMWFVNLFCYLFSY